MVAPILGYSGDTIAAIVSFADANDLPPIALLAMGLQESNLNDQAIGDVAIGGSYGVFQIYVVAHGGPPTRWTGYQGTVNAMAEMKGRWHQAFTNAGGWAAVVENLPLFMQQFAPDAQGSIGWSRDMAEQRVSKAMALYTLHLKLNQAPAAPPPPVYVHDAEAVLAAVNIIATDLQDEATKILIQVEHLRALDSPGLG